MGWWKVAALIILIAGSGTLVYKLSNTTGENNSIVAIEKTSPLLQKTDTIGPAPEAAKATIQQTSPTNTVPARLPKPATTANETISQNDAATTSGNQLADSVAADQMVRLSQKAEEKVSLQTAPVGQASSAEAQMKTTTIAPPIAFQEFKGKVLDPEGEPLPFATVHLNKNMGTVADANGRFSLRAQDTAVAVTVAAPGYLATTAKLSSLVKENAIVIKEKNDDDLAEVVVTGMMRKRQAELNRDRVLFSSAGVEPVKGWKHYNNYINAEIRGGLDGGEEYLKGEVQLEFSINKRGRPVDINVLRGTSEQLSARAIELLKDGPGFKQPREAAKAKITIGF